MRVKELLISEECTILQAMELLDKVANKVLFVVQEEKLMASITDGDIRRWILKKGKLDATVDNIANYTPKYTYGNDRETARALMKKHSIEAVPIVNENMNIISVVLWYEKEAAVKKKLVTPVVIMAGGLGKRLYPYTKILPKALIPIGEIPISEHIINRFNKYGCKEFFLIVNHKKNMIKAYYNKIEKDYSISYADEDKPLGTGGGLSLLKGKINSTFILSNCDILIKEDYEMIYNHHKAEKNLITMVCSLKHIKIPYGVITTNKKGEIENMKEKPEIPIFANTGMYIVEPEVINIIEENKFIGFPDIIKSCMDAGKKVGIYPISENAWLDMGQLDEMEEMRSRLEHDE